MIMWRDGAGKIRVFLNSCRHRGMKVCRTDAGNARQFRCSFHGWTYGTDGTLLAVPYQEQAYGKTLDRNDWGLREVPKVQNYGGFIFASWDAGADSLDQYLGDARWYFDITIERSIGDIEFIRGHQRYKATANWKLMAENFCGDAYHLPYSHGSVYKLDIRQISPVTYTSAPILHTVSLDNGHGMTSLAFDNERYETDLKLAEEMGKEEADYIRACRARLAARLDDSRASIFALGFGNLFPNFAFNNFSALRPMGFYQAHPRAAHQIEMWQWCGVDRDAPASIKEMIRVDFARTQAASGLAAQDDAENFEQVTEATSGAVGQDLQFNYQMGLEQAPTTRPGVAGRISPYFSENNQMNFYSHWSDLMEREAS